MTSTTPTPSVFDVNSLVSLKARAKNNDPEALKATAKQFESLFLQMVLKSMRDASPREGMFDSDQTRMYESLLDSQLAQVMADKGSTGLAAMIERQFARKNEVVTTGEAAPMPLAPKTSSFPLNTPNALPLKDASSKHPVFMSLPSASLPLPRNVKAEGEQANSVVTPPATSLPAATSSPSRPVVPEVQGSLAPTSNSAAFAARMRPYAEAAEQATGIPANFMIAQAALETGWGRSEPRRADGGTSYNLFGLKAGRSWKGASVEAGTTEYVNGQPQRQVERFRAYASYAEAFNDYANLLSNSSRYSEALSSRDGVQFARALQSAGYATDPQYAAKLERIMASPALRT